MCALGHRKTEDVGFGVVIKNKEFKPGHPNLRTKI